MNLIEFPVTPSQRPLFSVGVVARMTEISVATLRAWERRYGFPVPARTPGGHRLFTENDVVLLRWIKEQIEAGVGTSAAILAARQLRLTESEQLPAPATSPGSEFFPKLRERFQEITQGHQAEQADVLLGEAMAAARPEEIILHLIGPTLAALGEAWLEGRISVATEHFWSHYLRQRLLLWMLSGPPAHDMQPLVLACAPGDLHEGGLLMLGALLRRRRWPIAYLGQDLPLSDLASFIRSVRPPAVVLAAIMESSGRTLTAWPEALPGAALSGRPIVAFGGRAFIMHPKLRDEVAGLYLGDTLEEAIGRLESALTAALGWPKPIIRS